MRKLPIWLIDAELERLFDLPLSLRDWAILAVFAYAGLRSNELRMLDVGDIDWELGQLHVRHAKRGKERIIPLHRETLGALRIYLAGRQAGPMFLSNRSRRISNQRLRSLVAEWGRRARIVKRRRLHPHALRHTFAVRLLETGSDLEMIRDLLGHESIVTTCIYLHCTTQGKRVAIDRL